MSHMKQMLCPQSVSVFSSSLQWTSVSDEQDSCQQNISNWLCLLKRQNIKQAKQKPSYLRGETQEESLVKILGHISVKHKVSNVLILCVKCSKLWTDSTINLFLWLQPKRDSKSEVHLNFLRHIWTCVTGLSNP